MVLPGDDELLSNAATCSQNRDLGSDDEAGDVLRECLVINVCSPLRSRIADLEEALRAALHLMGLASVENEGCGDPWCSAGGGHFSGVCEGAVRASSEVDRIRNVLSDDDGKR